MASVRNGIGAIALVTLAFLFYVSPAWTQEELEIDKDATPTEVRVGETVTFDIEVTNDTSATADIVIEDELPDEVALLGVRPTDGGRCTIENRTVRCVFRDVDDQDTVSVELDVEPTVAEDIENTAETFVVGKRQDTIEVSEPVTVQVTGRNNNNDNNGDDDRRDRDDRFRERVNEVLEEEGLIDEDGDGDIDEEDEFLDAQEDLEGETTDGELTDADTLDDDGSAVSATADEDGAEASTPGAVARSGGDPDELAPLTSTPDNVVNEIPTSGPLPNTGGMPLFYWLLPLAGLLILAGLPVYRWAQRRG